MWDTVDVRLVSLAPGFSQVIRIGFLTQNRFNGLQLETVETVNVTMSKPDHRTEVRCY